MSAGHTPGPWAYSRWDQFGDARFYIAQADGAQYTPNYSDVATLVAETVSGEYVRIQEANARLIAAAPELLAIAERLALAADEGDDQAQGTHYVDKHGAIRCKGSFLSLIEEARAVIAKATGAET